MKKYSLLMTLVSTMMAGVALADINPGCLENYDCDKVELLSVELVDVSTCKYNDMALAPHDPAGAVQCDYNVTYKCDGVERTRVVISPARFGCALKQP